MHMFFTTFRFALIAIIATLTASTKWPASPPSGVAPV